MRRDKDMSTEGSTKPPANIGRRWHTISEVVAHFSLSADPSDRDAVIAELRRRLADRHPDLTGGAFSSADDEEAFHEISAAIRSLQEGDQTSSMTVTSKDLALIRQAVTVLHQRETTRQEQSTRRQILADAHTQLRRSYRVPLITAGTALSCCTALLAFMKSLRGTSSFSFLLASPAKYVLLVGWAASGILFLFLWIRERLAEREVRYLLSDEALLACFRGACFFARREGRTSITAPNLLDHLPGENPGRAWWRVGLKPFLYNLKHWRHWVRETLSIHVDQSTREQIVEDYLTRLLDRRVLTPSSEPDVVRRFEVVPGLLEKYGAH
jgi:hypothetical protein